MLKMIGKVGKVIGDFSGTFLVIGGAMLIGQKLFLNGYKIGEVLDGAFGKKKKC